MRSKSRLKKAKTKPTSELRSSIMRAISSTHTKPEETVLSWLRSARFKPLRNVKRLPGSPDFVIPRKRVAILVHGCFWHKHRCRRGSRAPKANKAYWATKLANNQRRDRRVKAELKRLRWRVIVLWECEIVRPNAQARLLQFIRHQA